MRKLTKSEIRKKDCQYCNNIYGRERSGKKITGFKKYDGYQKEDYLYCEFDKCPYDFKRKQLDWSICEKGNEDG